MRSSNACGRFSEFAVDEHDVAKIDVDFQIMVLMAFLVRGQHFEQRRRPDRRSPGRFADIRRAGTAGSSGAAFQALSRSCPAVASTGASVAVSCGFQPRHARRFFERLTHEFASRRLGDRAA